MVERCWLVAKQWPESRFAELSQMGADGEAVLFRCRKNLRRFFRAEGSAITEDIHELSQPALRDCRHHFITDEVNIFLRTPTIFGRDRVRAEKRRHNGP